MRNALCAIGATLLIAAGLALAPAVAGAKTVWLCKPGVEDDPCSPSLSTTRFSPTSERRGVDEVRRARRRKIDCFYVYPTVSDQPRPAATRAIDPALRSIALYQAARYSRDCRVFAPVYRQITIQGLYSGGVTEEMAARAYGDVRAAWRDYLRRYNRGRGVVLIGHSQGTFQLRRLISQEIDGRRSIRRRLVSALLLGGQVTVRAGDDAGGDFERIRACRSARQLHCVVAFSTYSAPVPAEAVFGRAGPGQEILCTNPAALGGGAARVDPVFPRAPFAPRTGIAAGVGALGIPRPAASTTWLSFPGAYTARCASENGANVLLVEPRGGAPVLNPSPTPSWGLHLADANIALGDLARLVRRQAARYARSR